MLIRVSLVFCIGVAAAFALFGLARLAAGQLEVGLGGWRCAPGAWPAAAVCAAAGLGVAVSVLLALLVMPGRGAAPSPGPARASYTDLVIRLAMLWPVTVIPLAAFTGQAWLIPASLSLPLLLAALAVALHTAALLQSHANRLEVRHDIVGIGGGIGAWRISPAAASALLALLLLAGAVGLATAGLPRDPGKMQQTGKTENDTSPPDAGAASLKKPDKPAQTVGKT